MAMHVYVCAFQSIVMIVFREDKPLDEELKAWAFWHQRQHSMKQRIMDVDVKNSGGIVGQVDEIAHNACQFYWNPMEQPVKVRVLGVNLLDFYGGDF